MPPAEEMNPLAAELCTRVDEYSFNPEAPAFTPLAAIKMRAEAAEFIPTCGGLAVLQRAAEALQPKQAKRQMPVATDEEWQLRIAKREKEVATIKSLQSYRLFREVFPHEDDPRTPDPRDRTISKRMWKWNVEKWRLELKGRCVYPRAAALQCREYVLRRQRERDARAPEREGAAPPGDPGSAGGEGSSDAEEEGEEVFVSGVLCTKPVALCLRLAAHGVDADGAPPGISRPPRAAALPAGAGTFH